MTSNISCAAGDEYFHSLSLPALSYSDAASEAEYFTMKARSISPAPAPAVKKIAF
jgi:hypothetical protein